MQAVRTLNDLAITLDAAAVRTRDLLPAMKAGRLMAVGEVQRRFGLGVGPGGQPWQPLAFPRARGGDKPLLDRGLLRASITGREDATSITVGTNLDYARLQQFGGVVQPKRAKMLAIPLTPAAARSGGPRRFPDELTARVRRGGQSGVLLDSRGVAQFALTRGPVKIPARPFLGWSRTFVDRFKRMLVDHLLTGVIRPVST